MSRLVAACALLVLSLLCHDAAAQEQALVIIRVADTPLGAVVERIRGQVSDLPVDVRASPLTALEPSADEQARAALQLGREQHAIAVVWLDPRADGALLVYVAASASGDVLVRQLDATPRNDDAATSVSLEMAAVVVRATLQALLKTGRIRAPEVSSEGDAAGRTETPSGQTPAQGSPPSRQTSPPPATNEQRRAENRPTKIAARLGLGWRTTIDGQTTAGLHGPLVRVDLLRGNMGFGLSGAVSLPGTIDEGVAHLRLVRAAIVADAFLAFPIGRVFALEGHGGAGLVLFHRSTVTMPSVGAFATPDRASLSPEVSADAVLSIMPLSNVRSLRLFFAAGAGFVFAPPRFDAMTSAGIAEGPALWALQPRFTAGLGWVF